MATLSGMTTWRYAELLARGLSPNQIRDRVRTGALHRVTRGTYVSGGQPSFVDRLHAVRQVLPPDTVFGFHTAARLYGFGVVPTGRIHVISPTGRPVPQISGVVGHQAVLPLLPVEVAGLPCAAPERVIVDLARICSRIDALAVVDAALRARASTPSALAGELALHDGLRGVRQAREVVPLGDPRPECRQESQLRMILLDGGLPAPEPQLWVFDAWDDAQFRLDLGYRRQRVGAEYDGRSHTDRERMRLDRRRHNWLAEHGWSMRYFTDVDIYRQPTQIVATMRAALAG